MRNTVLDGDNYLLHLQVSDKTRPHVMLRINLRLNHSRVHVRVSTCMWHVLLMFSSAPEATFLVTFVIHLLTRLPPLQERALAKSGGWRKAYFMPGTSDTAVASWCSWMGRFGRAMPLLTEELPPQMAREQALDRYTQHTVHCSTCQKVRQEHVKRQSVCRCVAA